MQYAIIVNGSPVALDGQDITTGDITLSNASMLLLSDAERAGYGIYPITDDAIPAGQVSTGSALAFADGTVARHFTTQAAPPAPIPATVTPVQGRLALNAAGKLAAVQTAINGADQATQIWFEYATTWERANPIVAALGTAIGLTSAQVDALFVQAAAIQGV